MSLFIISVVAVLAVWGVCSLAEASIYAVRMPYVRQLQQSNVSAGRTLAKFKANMEQPISAILIVNTIVAAAGASIAGAQASVLFGDRNLWWFSALFTCGALFISEIIPKIIGVAYNRSIARVLARPLSLVVVGFYPLIWVIERASVVIKPRVPLAVAPEVEVQQMAEISAEEGSIMPFEADLVRNVLDLDKVTAGEIMTPISVTATLPDNISIGDVPKQGLKWNFSRIPLHSHDNPLLWSGHVMSRDVLAALARDEFSVPLRTLAKPIYYVADSAPCHKLLNAFLKRRSHMFGVVGADRTIVGIVTLEDVLESLIGLEIVDESDTVVDMRELARHEIKSSSEPGPSDG